MWIIKSCPRCRGDIFIDEDIDRTYIKCLQCGYEREMAGKPSKRQDKAFLAEKETAGISG